MTKLVNEAREREILSVKYRDIEEEGRWTFRDYVEKMVGINADNLEFASQELASKVSVMDMALKSKNLTGAKRDEAEDKVLDMPAEEDFTNPYYVDARRKFEPDFCADSE